MDYTFDVVDNQFTVLRALGKGYTAEVLEAEDFETKTKVAIKIYNPTNNMKLLEKNFINEVNTMMKVKHQNVVNLLAGNNRAVYRSASGEERNVMYLGLEICPGGEFFDYIAEPGKGLCENSSRFYFQQLINGVNAVHQAGVVHRDLKTENLFVDPELNLKVGDFGFAKFIDYKGNKDSFKTSLGTPGYQSPELLEEDHYSGTANDVFACGVILFIMYCGFPPLREANKADPWYRNFIHNTNNDFWKMHTRNKRTPPISDSFKELINGMLAHRNRYTMEDVIKSPWFNEKPINLVEVNKDMLERKAIVDKSKKSNGEQMEIDTGADESGKIYRGGKDGKGDVEVFMKLFNELSFGDFVLGKWHDSDLRRNDFLKFKLAPKSLLSDVCSKIIIKYPDSKVNLIEGSYKGNVTFSPNMNIDENIEDITQVPIELDIDFEVLEEGDEGSVIQFNKKDTMSQFDFRTFFEELKESYKN